MTGPKAGDASTRKWLAFSVVGVSVLGIIAVSAVAILGAGNSRAETTRLVFSSVLPLLGTWVGTVLAFYFARENLQAATESTLALAKATETETPVSAVMIRDAQFTAYDVGSNERIEDVPLAAVVAKMRTLSPPARRLPIRNPGGAVLYVIHDSTVTAFAESRGETSATLRGAIADMVADPGFKVLIEAIGYVPEKATVADARAAMASIKNCNDVFVTSTGKRDERALGWLTNTLLAGVQ
jgi:hypothetical protein